MVLPDFIRFQLSGSVEIELTPDDAVTITSDENADEVRDDLRPDAAEVFRALADLLDARRGKV